MANHRIIILFVIATLFVLIDGLNKYNRANLKGLKEGDFTDRIVFKTNRQDDPEIWFSKKHPKFEYIKQFWIGDTKYIIARKIPSPNEIMSLVSEDPDVKELRKSDEILWVEQETLHVRVTKTMDTEWANLWHLNGDVTPSMEVSKAWEKGYSGKGKVVAVLDDGLQTNHPDLAANVDTENDTDIFDSDNDPTPPSGNGHGTTVSGFIAAERDNNLCTVGVAYNSTLVGVRILGNRGITDSDEAQALTWKNDYVDIYSNSWGPRDGSGFSGPGPVTQQAVLDAVTRGRGGKGSIYLWAAGNGDTDDNCNGDGYTNSIYTIGITSTDTTKNAFYSEVCAAALAATPGGSQDDRFLTSTQLGSTCGSNGVQGTSFSTPLASAIVAVTLEANPALTWRDIQHLIVLTSTRRGIVDSYNAWETNGAYKEFSQVLGFGLMNADAMTKYAVGWTTVPTQQTCTSATNTQSVATSSKSSSSITISSSGCSVISYLEHVNVAVTFSYSGHRGNVYLTLISPQGTKSRILTTRPSDSNLASGAGSLDWTYMSVHFWRENPIGTWTLEFGSSNINGNQPTVTLTSWTLKFYGTTTEPLQNINLCSDSPCSSNQTCFNRVISYACCPEGFTGNNCTEETSTISTPAGTSVDTTTVDTNNADITTADTSHATTTTADTSSSVIATGYTSNVITTAASIETVDTSSVDIATANMATVDANTTDISHATNTATTSDITTAGINPNITTADNSGAPSILSVYIRVQSVSLLLISRLITGLFY